ncbi:MAG: hypothetical protein L6290_11135 [Thermodesulfovibrionales bacterium]|nr:hypothetical protein [Thermodesulfovibrionales bacterium]
MDTNNTEGTWFDFYIDNSDARISLKIRAIDAKEGILLTQKHACMGKKKRYKVKMIESRRFQDEFINCALEDFTGIVNEENKPLEVNFKNKRDIFNLPYTCKGKTIADFIIEKTASLAGLPQGPYPNVKVSQLISKMNQWRKSHG